VSATPRAVPVSVVVPTLDRPDRLRACLDSVGACDPAPAEVVVVAQGDAELALEVVAGAELRGARVVPCSGRGIGRGVNLGAREARHETVVVTHDDCTVDPDWAGVAWTLAQEDARRLSTGRVRPAGDAEAVPSTIDSDVACDYRDGVHFAVLYPNNMVVSRTLLLELGGFDERLVPAAEDNDLCYRWLRAGLPLRYDPRLVVWHHEWRTRDELERLYVGYAVGEGMFLAKHLRAGDLRLLRYLVRYAGWGCRGLVDRVVRGRPRWSDWRQGIPRGLPIGLVRGLVTLGPRLEERR